MQAERTASHWSTIAELAAGTASQPDCINEPGPARGKGPARGDNTLLGASHNSVNSPGAAAPPGPAGPGRSNFLTHQFVCILPPQSLFGKKKKFRTQLVTAAHSDQLFWQQSF